MTLSAPRGSFWSFEVPDGRELRHQLRVRLRKHLRLREHLHILPTHSALGIQNCTHCSSTAPNSDSKFSESDRRLKMSAAMPKRKEFRAAGQAGRDKPLGATRGGRGRTCGGCGCCLVESFSCTLFTNQPQIVGSHPSPLFVFVGDASNESEETNIREMSYREGGTGVAPLTVALPNRP